MEDHISDMDRIFHHIIILLNDLKVKNWKATVVGKDKVVVERKDISVVNNENFSSSLPVEKQGTPVNLSLKSRKAITPGKDADTARNVEEPKSRHSVKVNTDVPTTSGIAANEQALDKTIERTSTKSKSLAGGQSRLPFPKVSTLTPLSKPRQKFTCKDCGRIFAKIQNLNTHVEVVHEGKRHDCPRCLKPFTRRDVLKSHLQAVHAGVKFKCPECPKEFSFVGALRYHQKVIHENIKVNRKRTLKLTNSSYGKRRKRQEESTDGRYAALTEMQTAKGTSTPANPECTTCGAIFKKPRDLRIHSKAAHGELKHNCTQCDKTFTRSTYLRAHVESVHKGMRFDCTECSKQFNQAQTLKNHVKVAHEGQKFDCVKCSKSFTQTASLKKHVETVHMGKRTKCPKCDKEFSEPGSMKIHLASVHDGKRFKCPKCPKEFTDPAHVRLHVKSLHQGLRFECDQSDCYKSFSHASSLKKHLRTHKNDSTPTRSEVASPRHQEDKVEMERRHSGSVEWHNESSHNNDPHLSPHPSDRHQRQAATAAAAEYINNVLYHIVAATKSEGKDHRPRSDDKADASTNNPAPNRMGSLDSPKAKSISQEPQRRSDGGGHNWASLCLTSLESPDSRG